jgi:hypothetical protein
MKAEEGAPVAAAIAMTPNDAQEYAEFQRWRAHQQAMPAQPAGPVQVVVAGNAHQPYGHQLVVVRVRPSIRVSIHASIHPSMHGTATAPPLYNPHRGSARVLAF